MKRFLTILLIFVSLSAFSQYRNQYGKAIMLVNTNYNFIRQTDTTLLTNYSVNVESRINFNKKKHNEFKSFLGFGATYFDWQQGVNNWMDNLGFLVYGGISDEEDMSISPRLYYLPMQKRLITEGRISATPFDNIFGVENLDLEFNGGFGFIHNLNSSASPTLYITVGISANYYLNFDDPYYKVDENGRYFYE